MEKKNKKCCNMTWIIVALLLIIVGLLVYIIWERKNHADNCKFPSSPVEEKKGLQYSDELYEELTKNAKIYKTTDGTYTLAVLDSSDKTIISKATDLCISLNEAGTNEHCINNKGFFFFNKDLMYITETKEDSEYLIIRSYNVKHPHAQTVDSYLIEKHNSRLIDEFGNSNMFGNSQAAVGLPDIDFIKTGGGYFIVLDYWGMAIPSTFIYTSDYKKLGIYSGYYDEKGVYAYTCPEGPEYEPDCHLEKSEQTHYDAKGNVIK